MTMKRHLTILFALTLLVALGSAGCRRHENRMRAPGIVQGDTITVKAVAPGTVVRMLTDEGAAVRPGALLVQIDRDRVDNGLQALELADAELDNTEQRLREKRSLLEATLAYWQRQTGRFERLRREQSISGEQLEKARLQLQEARTGLFDLEKALQAIPIQRGKIANQRGSFDIALKDLELKSPVAGVVMERFVSSGEQVMTGTALLEILDTASLYVETFLEERELGRLKLGDRVTIRVDGMETQPFSGTISFFGRKAEFSPKYILSEKERQALLYQVKVRIDAERERFKVGMPVTLEFAAG
jgi:HlyD family secretion protein